MSIPRIIQRMIFKELEQSTSGVYYGVGIYLTQDIKTGIITVVKPVKGSPADGSGLKKGIF
mgnify:CR=1 FL=1